MRRWITAAGLALMAGGAAAQDASALAARIEALSASSTMDSWPLEERAEPRYLLALRDAQAGVEPLAVWDGMRVEGCDLVLESGFWVPGAALPQSRIRLDLARALPAIEIIEGSRYGYDLLRLSDLPPDAEIEVIDIPQGIYAADVTALLQEGRFQREPARHASFTVHYPKGEASPVPDLLRAIRDYQAAACLGQG